MRQDVGGVGVDQDLAALGHRIAGVDDEVDQRIVECAGVDAADGFAGIVREGEFDRLAGALPQQGNDLVDQFVDFRRLGLERGRRATASRARVMSAPRWAAESAAASSSFSDGDRSTVRRDRGCR